MIFLLVNLTISADGDSVVTTNPGYPKPYKVALQKCSIFRYRYTHSAGPGQGVAVFFYQFLANAGDCVTADTGHFSLCGDAMDHVNMKKALVVNSTATITMQSISSPDSYYHSGIYMRSSLFGRFMPPTHLKLVAF
ncbi:unnamed protein product [Heligmosomoides polygyrus]|uniref:CUB domain-containing protein n=1 Tax=Heligmosomoides polygyrus TaxID=6339 RepID=A0A183FFA7_HELPZ|nr:unnamed protein product [Heligmosomoides polygyrus]